MSSTSRSFSLLLADTVASVAAAEFPIVVGGDCSILLGALAGLRRRGPLSLVHIDGHSDFRHPGNYGPSRMPSAVAGMDLALATGRGEALMTDWPSVSSPLVSEEQIVQIGERDGHHPNFAWLMSTTPRSHVSMCSRPGKSAPKRYSSGHERS